MPKRTEKSGIEANISEHRPLYIFGLNRDKKTGELFTKDRTEKAKKSHKAFVEKNLEFIEDLKSPIIDAYRQFLLNWNPEDELENKFLLGLGKIMRPLAFPLLYQENQIRHYYTRILS